MGARSDLDRYAFPCLLSVTFLTAIGNTGLISVMPAIGRVIGITDTLVASIFSLSALIWAIASPGWARVADRRGRKPLIQLGLLGFIGSMIGCGLIVYGGLLGLMAPLVTFIVFFVVRSSYGLFGSASATAVQAYIADRTEGLARVRALSGQAGALSLGTIFGPAIAPFLILPPFALATPMFVFSLAGCLALVMTVWMIPRETMPVRDVQLDAKPVPAGKLWRDPQVAPFFKYGIVLASAQAMNLYTLGFVVIDRLGGQPIAAQKAVGTAMVGGALAGLFAQWGLVNWLRLGPWAMVRWGAGLAFIGNAVMMLGSGYPSLLIGFSLACLGYGLGRPGFSAGASLAAGPGRQAGVAGVVSSIAGASIVGPPILSVLLYESWAPAPFVLACAGLFAVTLYSLVNPALRNRGTMFPEGDNASTNRALCVDPPGS
ncbi:MFS transporter [Sphingomonas sp. G-3-2-10]|uniref:MFS transporter n=1 Tax=Sphingomonas sp. G-3-2-10 TaxID=2728838 RepID=UPI00146DCE36|nr:MFS transporter [Sphingomonas sp. G-3-2-10]NML08387.1 MFS transporter [Sphingomonas sp. G-3-2-10]